MMQAIMHVHMILAAVAIAISIRLLSLSTNPPAYYTAQRSWQRRWAKALSAFTVPPLFLVMTAVAIVTMGASSCHAWEGYLSYALSFGFVLSGAAVWLYLVWQSWASYRLIRQYPLQTLSTPIGPVASRIIDMPAAFSAQVGLWASELVVSKPLLQHLDAEHLTAVLAHESGHAYYRDTFWFFWLGGLRKLTYWLPGTETLWQELLLLRELRADSWAVKSVDKLVLAESLVRVVSMSQASSQARCSQGNFAESNFAGSSYAGFSVPAAPSRLAQRIDALLSEDAVEDAALAISNQWLAMAWALTPLLTIPFHQ